MENKNVINKLNDRNIARQSYSLNFSTFNLSALSLDVLFMFYTQITKEDTEFNTYKVSIKDIEKKLGKRIRHKENLHSVVRELTRNVIEIKKGKNGLFCAAFAASAEYDDVNNTFVFEISYRLKEHLLQIKESFVLIHFDEFVQLKGSYTKRLYSMFRQFANTGIYKTSVQDLIKVFDLDKGYNYTDIKRQIIEPAVKEISEKTNTTVSYKEIKEGKKVVKLEFYVKTKKYIPTPEDIEIDRITDIELSFQN